MSESRSLLTDEHMDDAPSPRPEVLLCVSIQKGAPKNSFLGFDGGEREESDVVPNSLTAIMDQTEATADEQEA